MAQVAKLLDDRDTLKSLVIECFRTVANGKEQLGLQELYSLRRLFSQKASVSEHVFSNISVDHVRFDFDGNGQLSINEAYKLFKFYLYNSQRSQQVASGIAELDVPKSSLEEAGYEIVREVGKGAQGTVYFAKTQKGYEKCIKAYKKEVLSAFGVRELKEEFEAMQLLACDRIAQAFEIFQDSDRFYMVGEAYHGGDFQTLKERAKDQGVKMTEEWWCNLFRQCFEGVLFMHGQAMMHCDLKEPNLMLRANDFSKPEVVIIDLGLSKAMVGKNKLGGTPGYMPPETHDHKMWFPKGDVFSMGVTMMQVVCDKIPPTGPRTTATPGGIFVEGCRTVDDIANATKTRQPPFHLLPKDMPLLLSLLSRLLQKQMQSRPTAYQALKDAWFNPPEEEGELDGSRRPRTFTLTFTSMQEVVNSRNRFCTDGITGSLLAPAPVA